MGARSTVPLTVEQQRLQERLALAQQRAEGFRKALVSLYDWHMENKALPIASRSSPKGWHTNNPRSSDYNKLLPLPFNARVFFFFFFVYVKENHCMRNKSARSLVSVSFSLRIQMTASSRTVRAALPSPWFSIRRCSSPKRSA